MKHVSSSVPITTRTKPMRLREAGQVDAVSRAGWGHGWGPLSVGLQILQHTSLPQLCPGGRSYHTAQLNNPAALLLRETGSPLSIFPGRDNPKQRLFPSPAKPGEALSLESCVSTTTEGDAKVSITWTWRFFPWTNQAGWSFFKCPLKNKNSWKLCGFKLNPAETKS